MVLSRTVDTAVASRGRSQVVQRTARISFTVVQWEHSHGDRDGLKSSGEGQHFFSAPIKNTSSANLHFLHSCRSPDVIKYIVKTFQGSLETRVFDSQQKLLEFWSNKVDPLLWTNPACVLPGFDLLPNKELNVGFSSYLDVLAGVVMVLLCPLRSGWEWYSLSHFRHNLWRHVAQWAWTAEIPQMVQVSARKRRRVKTVSSKKQAEPRFDFCFADVTRPTLFGLL